MKISVEGLNSRFELAEERFREFKDRSIEIIQKSRKKKKKMCVRCKKMCGRILFILFWLKREISTFQAGMLPYRGILTKQKEYELFFGGVRQRIGEILERIEVSYQLRKHCKFLYWSFSGSYTTSSLRFKREGKIILDPCETFG